MLRGPLTPRRVRHPGSGGWSAVGCRRGSSRGLLDVDQQTVVVGSAESAVDAEAPPDGEVEGQQANLLVEGKNLERITVRRGSVYLQGAVPAFEESGGAEQRGGPHPAGTVPSRQHGQVALSQERRCPAGQLRWSEHALQARCFVFDSGLALDLQFALVESNGVRRGSCRCSCQDVGKWGPPCPTQ